MGSGWSYFCGYHCETSRYIHCDCQGCKPLLGYSFYYHYAAFGSCHSERGIYAGDMHHYRYSDCHRCRWQYRRIYIPLEQHTNYCHRD
jgi:hypothetical protein